MMEALALVTLGIVVGYGICYGINMARVDYEVEKARRQGDWANGEIDRLRAQVAKWVGQKPSENIPRLKNVA